VQLAYLACVAIFHAVDRAADENGTRSANLRREECKESLEFKLVDVIAHHFKHVKSSDEKIRSLHHRIPIGLALGFDKTGESMDLRNIYFLIREAVRFVHKKAGTTHPKLP
jgi:hypothetical protein